MKKYIILAAIGALIATSCTQSEIQQPIDPQQGEPIEMQLNLPLDQSQAVGRAEPQTASWSGDGFEAQITTEPIDNPQSKAVADATVANVWVLQFDGTATTSKLIYKLYIPAYTAGSTVQLLKATADNRVAIVANTFDATWADAFALNSATWATVSAATKGVAAQSDVLRSSEGTDYLPMSGSSTGTLAVGGTLDIPLARTVVQVVVNLKSGEDLKAAALDVQLCGVPNATSWFPDAGLGVWPASPTVVDYPLENVTGITTTGFVARTFWVPVNRRGTVAGTTGLTRATNAPAGATYLSVSAGGWSYKVHLGANFATDYNLTANTKYTYSLTFQTDPAGTDSRVGALYVEIDSLCWAVGNLVADGASSCKIGAPEDYGLYFQFGSLVGWNGGATGNGVGTGDLTAPAVQVKPATYSGSTAWETVGRYKDGDVDNMGYNLPATDDQTSGIGDPCRVYLGAPWRTPTAAEYLTLVGADGANTNNGVPLKVNSSDLSFPATGRREAGGVADYVGSDGCFLSSSASGLSSGYSMVFNSSSVNPESDNNRSYGMPVRCVQPVPTVPNPPAASDYVTIGSLKWTKGNLIAVNGTNAKVGAPEDYGLYFQFGSLVGWNGGANGNGVGTGSPATAVQVKPATYSGGTAWTTVGRYTDAGTAGTNYGLPTTDAPTTGIGDPCRVYLGAPWRTPTAAEYGALDNAGRGGWVTSPAAGRWFGESPGTASSSVFFPASGRRDASIGALNGAGSSGYSWSSSVRTATYGYSLGFTSGSVTPQGNSPRSIGMPVRCVASS